MGKQATHPDHIPLPTLQESATLDAKSLLTKLQTLSSGLSKAEAEQRLVGFGPNEIAGERPDPWPLKLLKTFNSPFNYLLSTLAIVSVFTGNNYTGILITVMILLSVFLRFFQEHRSGKAAEKLKALVQTTVSVYREEGNLIEIPLEEVVPGDVISLSAGKIVPADCRLLESKELLINQSSLTGEVMPVEKYSNAIETIPENPLAFANICFMGTYAVSGTANAVVIQTGLRTYFGALAEKVTARQEETTFDKGLNALSLMLIRLIVLMVGAIFLINGLDKGNWLEAFLFALSVGVGLTPELLPMIVTTNLAKGAMAMSAQKVIVKRLSAIQNLGAMDVLCTDKTGTLTQNRIILDQHLDLHGKECLDVLKYAYLNSYYQSGLKNVMDVAILKHGEEDDQLKAEREYFKVDEIPFDFTRRRMSVIVGKDDGARLLICKGAMEEMFQVCTRMRDKGHDYHLDTAAMKQLHALPRRLNEDGFRVLVVGCKEVSPDQTVFGIQDEVDLTLFGFLSFLDPPKESASQALRELAQLGISVKILTGDNEIITRKICNLVGLPVDGILTGGAVDALEEGELAKKVEGTTIFAKLTPDHKDRIVRLLRKNNHVTGYLGDGINDAPPLKASDIGISVDNAVDIAKESADIILLENSLLVLKDGVVEGRRVFANIIKYIRMTTSSNFGNVFSMLGASAFLPFLPMKPIHILIQNLLYDFSQTAVPLDTVDPESLDKPQRWELGNIRRFMFCFGPVSSLFDYATFGVLWFMLGANSVEKQSMFQSGWFVEGLLSQTLIVHFIRTRRIPFLQSWAAWPLTLMTGLIISIGIYLPFSPVAPLVGLTALPVTYFRWLLLILLGYFILTQVVKRWFIGRYGYD